ncbi:MAG: MltA domain-containing protein [Candidatus Aminicenantes bacterium]|nr:MltA domain-containing protein [Candidatus Aminicenantes bacterium]
MKKLKRLALLGSILLILIFAIYFLQFLKIKPPEWTPENSLVREIAPVISDQLDTQTLIQAIDFSLKYVAKMDPRSTICLGGDSYTIEQLRLTLIDFKNNLIERGLSPSFFQYLKENYLFYQTPAPEVIFTGYYEAHLNGSVNPSDQFRFPLYRKPDDLVRIELSKFHFFSKYKGLPPTIKGRLIDDKMILPYYSREEIDSRQKLSGKNLEIVWVDDSIDVFFLHIQGSGVITLNTGEKMRVNYAESNGHPYRAIGKLLLDRGILNYENMSMQSIRTYLQNHPDEIESIFSFNPSYVFFRMVEDGPMGSIGVPLTPYRSIALDHRLFPGGALCYIETEIPVTDNENLSFQDIEVKEWKKFSGFVLNQDTGGAIRGPGRIDLFTGHGDRSEWIAGHMKQPGTFYFLIKKQN